MTNKRLISQDGINSILKQTIINYAKINNYTIKSFVSWENYFIRTEKGVTAMTLKLMAWQKMKFKAKSITN